MTWFNQKLILCRRESLTLTDLARAYERHSLSQALPRDFSDCDLQRYMFWGEESPLEMMELQLSEQYLASDGSPLAALTWIIFKERFTTLAETTQC